MATDLENMKASRTLYIDAQLAAAANPQVTYSAGGRTFDHAGYHRYLQDLIDLLSDRILEEGGAQTSSTVYLA